MTETNMAVKKIQFCSYIPREWGLLSATNCVALEEYVYEKFDRLKFEGSGWL